MGDAGPPTDEIPLVEPSGQADPGPGSAFDTYPGDVREDPAPAAGSTADVEHPSQEGHFPEGTESAPMSFPKQHGRGHDD